MNDAESAAASRVLRLLYVEDNRVNALLFEQALQPPQQFELRIAEDCAEALSVLDDWLPDVLVIDAHLPDGRGDELLRQLRQRSTLAATPAFMCSADALDEDRQRALAAGFVGYWIKPVSGPLVLADLAALPQA